MIFCPSCSDNNILSHGSIPSTLYFAGKAQADMIPGGALYQCKTCHLYFRFPKLSNDDLSHLYKSGRIENWKNENFIRNDWKIVTKWIEQNLKSGDEILDIGCFDGGLLSLIGSNFKRSGIEIHEQACEIASQNGINIIGHDFSDLQNQKGKFDAVLSVDTIEHTDDPLLFLENLSNLVKLGGYLIISTGNTDSRTWKKMKSRYWYCSIAEHIAFINPAWCHTAAKKVGLTVENYEIFSHIESSFLQKLKEYLKNMIYHYFPKISAQMKFYFKTDNSILNAPNMAYYPPVWLSAQDHFVVVFKKIDDK